MHRYLGVLAACVALCIAIAAAKLPTTAATGRVRVTSDQPAVVRVFTRDGAFALNTDTPQPRRDTLSVSTPVVLTIDVTAGELHLMSDRGQPLRVEAAMFGDSPASWLSGVGRHVVFARGGGGIQRGD